MHSRHGFSENTRGILFMLATVTGFAFGDAFVKLASADLSIAPDHRRPQPDRGARARRPRLAPAGVCRGMRTLAERFLALRAVGEIGGDGPLSDRAGAPGDRQCHGDPAGRAARHDGHRGALRSASAVGVRRWTAIGIGFLAVLLIVRPGLQGFNAWSLLALASVGFIVLRDLSSRALPPSTHPLAVSTLSLLAMIPLGLAMLPSRSGGR